MSRTRELPTHRVLGLLVLTLSCGDAGGRDSYGFMSGGITSAGSAGSSTSSTSSGLPGSASDSTSSDATSSDDTPPTSSDGTTATGNGFTGSGPGPTTEPSGTTTTTDPGTTTEPFIPEHFMLSDPLKGGTMGAQVGGMFGDNGWTVTAGEDRIYWSVPRLAEGSVTFTISNVTLANMPANDHEIFAMYEGGYGIGHPINYAPEFRQNAFKSMIRIYGEAEDGREGQQKMMWGICPLGAAYHDGTCPCTSPVGFFEEPFGGDPNWDGSPQVLKVEWQDGWTRFYRNGAEVEAVTIDWSGSGFTFGPQELYVSLGTGRPLGPMPIGAVFSDVVIEGWTGPETPVCAI